MFLRLCSEWEEVVPMPYGHEGNAHIIGLTHLANFCVACVAQPFGVYEIQPRGFAPWRLEFHPNA